jgi:hypothetical protein
LLLIFFFKIQVSICLSQAEERRRGRGTGEEEEEEEKEGHFFPPFLKLRCNLDSTRVWKRSRPATQSATASR